MWLKFPAGATPFKVGRELGVWCLVTSFQERTKVVKLSCRSVIQLFNNYWMRLSMIARIIKAEVCVICRSRRLRRITQTEALIILAIMRKPNPIIVLLCIYLSKCSMCSLNKKYHPLFELLHKTAALAHLQAFVSFEIHLLSFLSNIDEKLSVYIFIIKKEVQVSADNMANLDVDSAMTKLLKLLLSVLGDVTSACIKLLSVGMTSLLHV